MAGKPKPTVLKKLHGTTRADRVLNDEPDPPKLNELPSPTMPLNKHGKKVWESVAPRVFALGLLTTVDVEAFSMYCYEVGMYKECRETIIKEGLIIYTGKDNYPLPHPLTSVANKHFKNAYDIGGSFGLTPSSRSRISTGIEKPKSGFDGLKKAN